MYRYLLASGANFDKIGDLKAAIQILREEYGAVSLGPARHGGFIYETETPIPEDIMELLGLKKSE